MPSERFTGLAAVLDAIRTDAGITQPALTDRVGLGRSVVAQRVGELESVGLVAPDGLGPSTGGRAPRRLRMRGEAGYVLGVDIATNELLVAVSDLAGNLLATRHEESDVSDGPRPSSPRSSAWATHCSTRPAPGRTCGRSGWGCRDRSPTTATPTAMPTMPDWDRFPTRARLAARWSAPVWMDNRVNLSALGERRVNPVAAASRHTIYLGGGESIGAAVVVDGRLYRGARGLAGEIGHVPVPEAADAVCRCGNVGCLDAVAGRAALVRDGRLLAETGQSPALAAILARTAPSGRSTSRVAADKGDAAAQALLHRSARLLGNGLATLVSVFNPDLVILGGGMARARAHLIAAIREAIYRRALPSATQDLRSSPRPSTWRSPA